MDCLISDTIRVSVYNDEMRYLPEKNNESDSCYDLFIRKINLDERYSEDLDTVTLYPGYRCLVKTGVYLEMTREWEALIRPRSGNALKMGITVLNSPGTIDSGYRGEVGVIIINFGRAAVALHKYNKIAQIAFRKIPDYHIDVVPFSDFNNDTKRSCNGFGSSGVVGE